MGSKKDPQPKAPAWGNKASKPLTVKHCGGCGSGRNSQSLGEFIRETHRVLEHTPWNQHQKGPISLWVVEEVTENLPRAEQMELFPLGPLPNIQCHNAAMMWVTLSG